MTEVVVIPPREGELIGDVADRRVEILSDHESLHATWSRFGPGREGADLHVHRRHTDLFYVLEGELTIRLGIDDEPVSVPAGQLVRVPPLVVHGFRNASDGDVTYLNLHAPGCEFAEFMRANRDGREFSYDQFPPPEGGGRPTSEVVFGEAVADVEAIEIAELLGEAGGSIPAESSPRRLESLFVLDGELALTAADRTRGLEANSWAQVPPGTPRSLSFLGSEPARYLRIRTPAAT
jgi:quercetin dioxygenase-like cupin family protein